MTFSIDAAFDGGNIRVVQIQDDVIDLAIEPDGNSTFLQWFYFRLAGPINGRVKLRIVNAGAAAFPKGWQSYNARVSIDRTYWATVPTTYADGILTIEWTAQSQLAWFALFAPYPLERHHALVAHVACRAGVAYHPLGHSLDGRTIDALQIGNGHKPIWLIGRQHAGEPMAEWWMEGALDWLTTPGENLLRDELLGAASIYVVPNMNPDGTYRGHLRTNAVGIDLNREWSNPSLERSPEVLCVRNAMDETGVAFSIDAHGDEAIAATFFSGFEGVPSFTEGRGKIFKAYASRLADYTVDFQTIRGYGRTPPGKANLSIATNQIAERYGAISMTLEMPFKDHDPSPDLAAGWSPERSKSLGEACLEVLATMIDEL